MPPSELLTRQEVLDRLALWRVEAEEGDLRFWEQSGILPRPLRRLHQGAVRAVYPYWYLYLVRQLRRLQRQGLSLAEIGPQLRVHARILLAYEATDPRSLELRGLAQPGAMTTEDLRLPPALFTALEHFAALYADFRDVPVERLELHVIAVDGRATKYPLLIAPVTEEPAPRYDAEQTQS